jgi:hypothetical protein
MHGYGTHKSDKPHLSCKGIRTCCMDKRRMFEHFTMGKVKKKEKYGVLSSKV